MLPYAEDVNYWKTGRSSPDAIIDRAVACIEEVGGTVQSRLNAWHEGREGFVIEFTIDGSRYRISWPVLESKTGNEAAARRQAASFIAHDVKAKAMISKVLGTRSAFLPYLVVGRKTLHMHSDHRLATMFDGLMLPSGGDQAP